MATLLVLSRGNCYTGWTGCRKHAKKPKPGDLSVLGLRLGNVSLDPIAVNFIRVGSPGRVGALARYSLAEPAWTTLGLSGSSTHTFFDARFAMARADALLRRAEVRADAFDVEHARAVAVAARLALAPTDPARSVHRRLESRSSTRAGHGPM
jgi:hypothetical protein